MRKKGGVLILDVVGFIDPEVKGVPEEEDSPSVGGDLIEHVIDFFVMTAGVMEIGEENALSFRCHDIENIMEKS